MRGSSADSDSEGLLPNFVRDLPADWADADGQRACRHLLPPVLAGPFQRRARGVPYDAPMPETVATGSAAPYRGEVQAAPSHSSSMARSLLGSQACGPVPWHTPGHPEVPADASRRALNTLAPVVPIIQHLLNPGDIVPSSHALNPPSWSSVPDPHHL